jgi:hypothetical protein
MSQSDYIRYKRVANELSNQAKNLDPVIGAGKYVDYKAFTLENTIINNKQSFTKLQPKSSVNIFGMQFNTKPACSTFKLCSDTNTRVNRKPLSGVQIYSLPIPVKIRHKLADELNVCNYC